MEEVTLETFTYEITRAFGKFALDSLGYKHKLFFEETAYDMIAHLRVALWGERQQPIVISYPSSWWQHFKRDVLHMKKYKMYTCKVDPVVIYPNLKVSVHDQQYFLHFHVEDKVEFFKKG
jgi:hypothetical protein